MLHQVDRVVYTHDLLLFGKRVPFYVGIGAPERPYYMRRNKYHANVVAKYGAANIAVSVWNTGLTMEAACVVEKELIQFLKDEGLRLTNLTVGGDGTVGYVWTDEQRAKKSGANHPFYGRRYTLAEKQKRSLSMKGMWDRKQHPCIGKVESETAKKARVEKITAAWTPEKRELHSKMLQGAGNPFHGNTHGDETKAKISKTKLGKRTGTSESYARSGFAVKGSKWVTNGETSLRLYEPLLSEQLLSGWWLGKCDKRGTK